MKQTIVLQHFWNVTSSCAHPKI